MSELHVIFGSGPVGLAVMRELLRREKKVKIINRTGKRPTIVPTHVEVLGGDAYHLDFTRQAAQDAAVVYQCAQPAYQEWVTKFIPLQTSILAGAEFNKAKLVVADNLYMYGEVNGPIHENLPYAATTRKGKTRALAANQLMDAHRQGRLKVAVGRASDFYGPHVLGSAAGDRMFLPAVKGEAAEGLGNLDVLHTYTFIDDFGRALVNLGESEKALGEVWHVPNAETVTTRQFIQMIYEDLGGSLKVKKMGRLMMAIGGLFIPAAREMVEMMYEFEKPFVVDDRKYSQAFDHQATSMREGIRQTIAWYQSQL